MRFIGWVFCGLIVTGLHLGSPPTAQAQEVAEVSTKGDAARELLAKWDDPAGPGLAVAIVADGETVFQKGYGAADLEHSIPISNQTAFHAASLSKQFTAFAISMLVDQGKLSLEDDVREILPELSALPEKISVAQLLDHTSGLREVGTLLLMAGWLEDDIVTQQQQYSMIARQRGLNFLPAEQIEYSNTGYALLAKIVEKVSDQAFDAHLEQTIFTPLGMDNTVVQTKRSSLVPNVANSYNVSRRGITKSILNREIVGSTGVITTIADLMKWSANFKLMTVGNERVFALMEQRGVTSDGEVSLLSRGQESRMYGGFETWSHGGRIAGFRSFLLRVPEANFTVALLSNRGDFDAAGTAFALADIYLADNPDFEKAAEPEWGEATQRELDSYAGQYELFPGAVFDISSAEGKLQFSPYGTGQQLTLAQSGKGEFVLNTASQLSIRFDNEPGEQAQELKYVIGLNGELTAHKTAITPVDPETLNLEEFTGIFFSEELQTRYELRVVDGTLTAFHLRLPPIALSAFTLDTFTGPGSGLQEVVFQRDSEGQVTSALVSAALAEGIVFEKLR